MAFVDIGVGTAMLYGAGIGAAAGGIYNGIQGKNVLNGALIGGAGGALLGGGAAGLAGASFGGAADTAAIAAGGAGGGGAFVPASGIATDAFTGSAVANTAAANAAAANAAAAGAPMGADMAGGYSAGANAVNPLDAYTGTANAIPPGTPSVPGVPNAANPAASGYGQYLKWGVPAAMIAYGALGPKSGGITGPVAGSTIGQSKPSSNMMNAGLSNNYRGYFQAKKGGIAKLAVGGGAEAQMTPDVNTAANSPADLNQNKNASLSPQTQSLLNQYGINPTQATQALSALQSQGIGGTQTKTGATGGIMGMAHGGKTEHHLGDYSDGGRLLKGPGDGMSDEIPATIAHKQPARLAEGEFVVPADVVSHLGNGSTDAGAKHLYKMMDNVRKARTGNKKQGKQIKADKYLPK